jgi:hypothetical protein
MSDHFPGQIDIGGPIPRAVLAELIRVIVAEGASLGDYGGPQAREEELQAALREGEVVRLCDDQARYGQFDALEAFLVKHRIHFDRYSEAFCDFSAEMVHYRGGKEAVVLPADQSGHVLLRFEEVIGILEDKSLDDGGKLKALRHLVARPETEPLAPIRFLGPKPPKKEVPHASNH